MAWSRATSQKLFQDDAGCTCVCVTLTAGQCFGGGVTFVHFEHRKPEAAAQLARKPKRSLRILVRLPVLVAWNANHQGLRLPFIEASCNLPKHVTGFGVDGSVGGCAAQEAVGAGHADAGSTKVEGEK
jgi:hypothetical protein